MQAKHILSETPYQLVAGELTEDISGIRLNSSKVECGNAFVAMVGSHSDGHKYVPGAIDNGASLVVIEDGQTMWTNEALTEMVKDRKTAIVSVPDSRKAYADMSCTFFGHPSENMNLIGITGTKGKTTTTYMVQEIFKRGGRDCGLLGSVENRICKDRHEWSAHTTPEAWEFQELLHTMQENNVTDCVMEVSSLGLKFHRTRGVHHKVGIFTNFFLDHIMSGEHADEEEYFACKMMLFDTCEMALVNKETRRLDEVLAAAQKCSKVYTYSINEDADFMAKDITFDAQDGIPGMKFTLVTPTYSQELFVPLLCDFNVDNALCASAAAYLCGIDQKAIREGLAHVYVPGRMEKIRNPLGLHVYVDYAHNGDSLRVLLSSLRKFCKGRIITVFGCGGERSQYRRSGMGESSARYSDYSIVTSDNSRSEPLESILVLIKEGINKVEGAKYEVIEDRREAITKAVSMATPDDFIVIAGKGHERTMEINKVKFEFVDSDEVRKAIDKLANVGGEQ